MTNLINRVYRLIDDCWISFTSKVGGGVININKEASMQLQFAYILNNAFDLIIYAPDEKVSLELETGISVDGRWREVDILISMKKDNEFKYLPIEMKCYKTLASSGKKRGGADLFMKDVYEDIHLLEKYSLGAGHLSGIQLTMTDMKNLVSPLKKITKNWDYDISHGYSIIGGVVKTTPIGGKPVNISLLKDYTFNWTQINKYYFLKLIANS
ncbi:hypothetical protein SNE26_02245 [Mucilaginibacter sp. cycad4]|uniref:hypothetical protein n=1 Tax=Mucilaginibacter sp. cycad4 TaxID=3342096 RepID=UPI002AAAE0E0|nr:hypothetical protein [Mucilaginibacter gossypii]WPV00585.1 hypothetical protein SNE26_02245 [Mucilaginibacter gossypii]